MQGVSALVLAERVEPRRRFDAALLAFRIRDHAFDALEQSVERLAADLAARMPVKVSVV